MKEIIFIVERLTGTAYMRGYQMHQALRQRGVPTRLMTYRELYKIFPKHYHKHHWIMIMNPYQMHLSGGQRKTLRAKRVLLNDDYLDHTIQLFLEDQVEPLNSLFLPRSHQKLLKKNLKAPQEAYLKLVMQYITEVLQEHYNPRLAETFHNKIFVVVKIKEGLTPGMITDLRLRHNVVVYDPVDAYVKKNDPKILNQSLSIARLFDSVIVLNTQMKQFYEKQGIRTILLHHHWDPRLEKIRRPNPSQLIGYMGETGNGNCLYLDEFQIPQVESFSQILESGSSYRFHYSVRDSQSVVGKYKSGIKLATASAMGCHIVITPDASVIDLLRLVPQGIDYPFLLADHRRDTVSKMLETLNDSERQNQSLEIMKHIREITSIKYVAKLYQEKLQSQLPLKLGNMHHRSKSTILHKAHIRNVRDKSRR